MLTCADGSFARPVGWSATFTRPATVSVSLPWKIGSSNRPMAPRRSGLAGLRPTTTAADELAPPELAVLDLQAGADLSRTDRLRFLLGYLGTARSARRALIGRIFAVREPAS